MSYCRFSEKSDVYVFDSVGGYLDCCGCSMIESGYHTPLRSEMIQHLQEHIKIGAKVPDHVISWLKEEMETIGDDVNEDDENPPNPCPYKVNNE